MQEQGKGRSVQTDGREEGCTGNAESGRENKESGDSLTCDFDGKRYVCEGSFEGYEVYVCYAEDGPDLEEAWALFEEARKSPVFQKLAGLGREMET